MFERLESVTICDQFIFFFCCKLETKVLRKFVYVPFNGLIQYFGSYIIKFGRGIFLPNKIIRQILRFRMRLIAPNPIGGDPLLTRVAGSLFKPPLVTTLSA